MSTDDAGDEREVERAVLAYLGRHPGAADTLDGITGWWLPRQRFVTAHDRVEAVLSRLVDVGVLELRRLPSGRALYALRRSRGDASPADEA